MSKELIEQLRADAESTDDIGLCADAADRIEELERKVASRDAEVVSLTNQRDYEYVRAENAEQERDELLALVIRYRKETPLGHQPHMIAHLADEAIAKGDMK